jgi:hypothetical protein
MGNRRVVVFCPPYYKTGGTEVLHQLVYKGNKFGTVQFVICYTSIDWKIEFPPTPPSFVKYLENNETIIEVRDIDSNDILIFPETLSKFSLEFRFNIKCIWWLSVDNFYNSIGYKQSFILKELVKKLFNRYPFNYINNILYSNLFDFHLVQSEYAQDHLVQKKILKKILPLSDYIGLNYNKSQEKITEKENYILYNPLKGMDVINKLIEKSNFAWVRLENKTDERLIEIYRKSKIYIDFGNHPGKDRIPREASIFGCVILTNKRGSAKNKIDIPIDDYYKFNEKDLSLIINRINEIFNNYEFHYSSQNSYRQTIIKGESNFESQIKDMLNEIV